MRYLLTLVMFWVVQLSTAQNEDWDYDFNLKGQGYSYAIDSKGAYAYVIQNDTVVCFDMVERAVVSKAYIKGSREAGINFLKGTPYYYMANLSSQVNGPKGRFVIANLYDGKVVIDSDWFKVAKLEDIFYDLKFGVVFVKHKVRRDLTPEEAAGARKGKIKRGIEEIKFSFFRFNEYEQRTIIPFEQGEKNFLSKGAEMLQAPIFSKDYLLAGIAGHLYCIDYGNGSIKWSKNMPDVLNFYNLKPYENTFLTWERQEKKKSSYLNYYTLETGEPLWEGPYQLGTYFRLQFGVDTIYVANMLEFDFLNLRTGKNFYEKPLPLNDYVTDIKRNREGIILNLRPAKEGTISFNLLKNNALLVENPPNLRGTELKFMDRTEKGYAYFTDLETGVFDTNGKILFRKMLPLNEPFLWQQDTDLNRLLFYLNDNVVKAFNYANGSFDFKIKVKFKGEDDFASRFWKVKDGYLISAKRNLMLLDFEGNWRYMKYYKQPGLSTGLKRALMNVGTFAAGSMMKDEVYELYADANSAGLIGNEDNWNDVENVMLLGAGGGAGAISSKYTNRLIDVRNRINESKSLSNYWIVEDKLEKKLFGLRVLDVLTGEEYKAIPIQSDKDIQYRVSASFGGILRFDGGKLLFYAILD